jgi:hypothetical protein
MMDVNTILQIWPILTLVGYVLMGWLLWHLSKSFVSRKDHEALKEEVRGIKECMEDVGNHLSKVSGRIESLPSAHETNRILLGLEEVRGTQRELIATMKGQDEVLKRIEHPVQLLMAEAIKKGVRHGG